MKKMLQSFSVAALISLATACAVDVPDALEQEQLLRLRQAARRAGQMMLESKDGELGDDSL